MLISLIFGSYYLIAAIIGFMIGMSMFKWLNQKFDVYYFGLAGMITTFGTCWGIATVATYFLGWVGIAIFILMKIVGVFTGGSSTQKSK